MIRDLEAQLLLQRRIRGSFGVSGPAPIHLRLEGELVDLLAIDALPKKKCWMGRPSPSYMP